MQSTTTEKIFWWQTAFGDEEVQKLAESVANKRISQGPVTAQFEREFAAALRAPYAVATTSGSIALVMALMALGIKRDDEVIVPDRTWVATAHAAVLIGAKAVVVDVCEDLPLIDVDRIQSAITAKTRAIIPVHINGRGANMRAIRRIAEKHGLSVIEDAAQAMFSRNADSFLGAQSEIGCFSLSVAKLISTGQGGLAITADKRLYDRMKLVGNHGVVDNFTEAWKEPGSNFKFTDLLASFGLVQLTKVPQRIAHVRRIYERYRDAMPDLPFLRLISVDIDNGEVPLWVEVLCPDRTGLIQWLSQYNIQARPFPPSLHTVDYFETSGDYPNSKRFNEQGLYLPCGPTQPLDNVDRVIDVLKRFVPRTSPVSL